MANPAPMDQDGIERYDQSFLVYMVRDFAILLVLVVIVELTVKFGLTFYNYQTQGQLETEQAANLLADNVKSIMTNSGGPVAARTVYPIIRKNHRDLGYHIAIEPSPATVKSIRENFGFLPRGMAATWPEGDHHEASVDVRAEEFCLSCHSAAKIDDILGRITVRRYLETDLVNWWHEVRVTGVLSLGKTLLHTILLYFLLRYRMEPLLALRGAVSRLAKAGSHLSFRAPVKSGDEFGELAGNLNKFLDRLVTIIDDLSRVLAKIDGANESLKTAQAGLNATAAKVRGRIHAMHDDFVAARAEAPKLDQTWLSAVGTVFAALRANADTAGTEASRDLAVRVQDLEQRLRGLVAHSERAEQSTAATERALGQLSQDMTEFRTAMTEMAVLEEKMHAVAEEGQILVRRLLKEEPGEPDGATEAATP